jgi:hypothetical protein
VADALVKSLHKLCLSDSRGVFSGWNEYTYSLSANYTNALKNHNRAIAVENLDVVMKTITFDEADWP